MTLLDEITAGSSSTDAMCFSVGGDELDLLQLCRLRTALLRQPLDAFVVLRDLLPQGSVAASNRPRQCFNLRSA
jgi:hypothetical protein